VGNSARKARKLRQPRSVAYSVELVLLNISQCFSVDLAVACLGLVVSYKSVVRLLLRAAAACLLSFSSII